MVALDASGGRSGVAAGAWLARTLLSGTLGIMERASRSSFIFVGGRSANTRLLVNSITRRNSCGCRCLARRRTIRVRCRLLKKETGRAPMESSPLFRLRGPDYDSGLPSSVAKLPLRRDEQQRLFYVSITRSKETLVISRALRIRRGPAKQLGLTVTPGSGFWADLKMFTIPPRHHACVARRRARRLLEWLRAGVGHSKWRQTSVHVLASEEPIEFQSPACCASVN